MAAKFHVPEATPKRSQEETEQELALQALLDGDDVKPQSPQEWLPFLHAKYCGTTSNVDRVRVGRALAQFAVTGSYDNADLFVARESGAAPPVSFAIDDYQRDARMQYKFGTAVATPTQTLAYMRCLASLVKRGFTLEDAQLPAPASQLATLFLREPAAMAMATATATAANALGTKPPVTLDRELCESAAKHYRQVGRLLSAPEAHAFLAIWIFVVFALYWKRDFGLGWLFLGPLDELVPVTTILRAAGYVDIADFVERAV